MSASRFAAAAVSVLFVAACGTEAFRTTPPPDGSPPPDASPLGDIGAAAAVSTSRPTAVRLEPSGDAEVHAVLRTGILLPVTANSPPFLEVLTPCEARGWVHISDVEVHVPNPGRPTVVIDPGHGGQHDGAVGPTGLTEKEANLDIARRLSGMLGDAEVFLTIDGDYTAGLGFRTTLANRLGADVFVSVHNNAEPDGPSELPGAETYYQVASPESKRLAGLVYEELLRSLEPLDVAWVADDDAGAKYRTNSGGGDYYAILRMSEVPAVLVESAFVVNPPEENLLRTDEGRDLIASAIAAGIRRYLGTEDPGSGFVTPYPREPGPSGRLPSVCMEPAGLVPGASPPASGR